MAIFDDKTIEKMGTNTWLSGADFKGDGLVLKVKSMEKVKSQYGAKADNGMVEREILEEGELFRYVFEDESGAERTFDSHSFPFAIALQNAEFNFGDWLHISRTGELKNTRYTAEKVDGPVSQEKSDSEISPEDAPF